MLHLKAVDDVMICWW